MTDKHPNETETLLSSCRWTTLLPGSPLSGSSSRPPLPPFGPLSLFPITPYLPRLYSHSSRGPCHEDRITRGISSSVRQKRRHNVHPGLHPPLSHLPKPLSYTSPLTTLGLPLDSPLCRRRTTQPSPPTSTGRTPRDTALVRHLPLRTDRVFKKHRNPV